MDFEAYKYIRYNASQETRWATVEEIQESCSYINLEDEDYNAAGLPIISDGKEAYVDNSDTHSLIFGATGSKKTRLFCMPMINIMAKAGESFVVTDPKGELYAQTSGLVKKKGYKTVVLNFRDIGKGDMWNPLSIPYRIWRSGDTDKAGALLSDITTTLASQQMRNTKDTYWPEAAQEFGIAGLYVLMEKAKKEEANMKSFANISSQSNVDNIEKITKLMREDSVAALNYGTTVSKAKQTAAGIIGSLNGMIRIFKLNDKLSQMLSDTSFDMRMFGREKTAVYIIVPDEKTTYHFLVTMFIKQAYEILIEEAQKEKNRTLPVRVNFVLDEFCNIPKIPDMPSMISAARSRNMRYFLVVQSMHQLSGRYGEDAETIKGNCDNWVFLTSKELTLLNEISELCGNIQTPEGMKRRLISTSELQRFNKAKGEALIMHARQYPIVSEMADISEYKMFGIYEPAEIKMHKSKEFSCFSMANLLQNIDELKELAPFPSDEHILSQAQKIYQQELSKYQVNDSRDDDDDNDDDDDDDIFKSSVKKSNDKFKGPTSFFHRFMNADAPNDNAEPIGDESDVEEQETDEPRKTDKEHIKMEGEAAELKALLKKEKVMKIKLARKKAKKRIAALVSEEYAARFFKEEMQYKITFSSKTFDWDF